MGSIRASYPIVFDARGSHKPHSKEYRDFGEKWGAYKTLVEVADSKIEKIEEIYQVYLNDYLTFLSYMIEKSEMEEREDAFQDNLRKAKRHK